MEIYEAGLNTNQDEINRSNYFPIIIEKLMISTKISTENPNKLFCHKHTIKFK